MFQKAADLNDPYALFVIGFYHENGRYGYKKNSDKAWAYYKKSIQLNGREAMTHIASSYLNGNAELGVKADIKKAEPYFEKAIKLGSLSAKLDMANLSLPYQALDNATRVQKYAKELCDTQTVYGAEGCVTLGFYHTRKPTTNLKSQQKAIELYKRAWQQGKGLATAAAALGGYYFAPDTIIKVDLQEEVLWLKRGCPETDQDPSVENQVVGRACTALGKEYAHGFKTKDYKNTRKYYEIGIREGFGLAYSSLAFLYMSGGHGVEQDYEKAYKLSSIASNKYNDADGMQMLGHLYTIGGYVKKDRKKAAKLKYKSAMLEHSFGMELYARAKYFQDKPDYKECYKWGVLAKIRNDDQAKSYVVCGNKLSKSEKDILYTEAKKLNRTIPRFTW